MVARRMAYAVLRGPAPMSYQSWIPTSWRERPIAQQPAYRDCTELDRVKSSIRRRAPLVSVFEIERLKSLLAEVAAGRAFLLQGGDCAESFDACDRTNVLRKALLLLRMGKVLARGVQRP